MPVKLHSQKIKYGLVELIRSRTLHIAILMFLLYIISVRKNTKSHFDWLLHFTSGRRREKFFVIVDRQDGLFHPVHISLSNVKLNSSSVLQKCIVSSVLLPLSLLLSVSVRMKRELLGEKIHMYFTKTTEEAAVNTILTYKNKPAKDHSLIPAGWM